MPTTISATINLPTPFGPAGYEVVIAQTGEVLSVASAAANLPEVVLRLSYAENWEAAREYFLLLGHNAAFQAEVAVWLPDPPADFKLLWRTFRNNFGESMPERREVEASHLRRVRFWLAHPEALPALFHHRKSSAAIVRLAKLFSSPEHRLPDLEAWVYTMLPLLEDTVELEHLYAILARLDTESGRDYLFGELERNGRHPYADTLLHGLRHFSASRDRARMISLYDWIGADADLMKRYLQLLSPFSGTKIHAIILRALADHPQEARHALKALRQTGHPAPEAIIRAQFDREENYFLLDPIAELIADGPEPYRVSLEEMNAKVAAPVFTDGAPVTWPQMLEPNWSKLVKQRPAPALFPLLETYLLRPEGRLQRNALLQLKHWLRDRPAPPTLPVAIEDRLRELIDSRYDKVSTVALDIIATAFLSMTDQEKMVDALLQHAPVSQYRLMVAAALKKAAEVPALRARQVAYFGAAIREADDAAALHQVERVLPYLTFLGVKEELKSMAKQRLKAIEK
jgi:hypothetical protein